MIVMPNAPLRVAEIIKTIKISVKKTAGLRRRKTLILMIVMPLYE